MPLPGRFRRCPPRPRRRLIRQLAPAFLHEPGSRGRRTALGTPMRGTIISRIEHIPLGTFRGGVRSSTRRSSQNRGLDLWTMRFAQSPLVPRGRRLASLIAPWGFPCCVRFPCVHTVASTPGTADGRRLRPLPHPYRPSPIGLSGGFVHRSFLGVLGVHEQIRSPSGATTGLREGASTRVALGALGYDVNDQKAPIFCARAAALALSVSPMWFDIKYS